MTDNEIIKALECCSNGEPCANCPYQKQCDETNLAEIALDLINRQKAEVERLKEEKQTIQDKFECQQTVYLDLSEIIKKQADELKTAKAEAIKEFAERLNKEFAQCQREYRAVLNSDGACAMIIARKVTSNLAEEMGCKGDA